MNFLSSSDSVDMIRIPLFSQSPWELHYPPKKIISFECMIIYLFLFFLQKQVVNHSVSMSLLEEFKLEIENFFKLPHEKKKLLWQQPDNHEGFGQLFVVSEEQKLDWSDMFYVTTLPHKLRKTDLFEKLPLKLRYLSHSFLTFLANHLLAWWKKMV